MALVPLAPGAPFSTLRIGSTLLLAVASALLFRAGRRRRRRFSIDLVQGTLEIEKGRRLGSNRGEQIERGRGPAKQQDRGPASNKNGQSRVSVAGARAIQLAGSADLLEEAARLNYRAELVLADGTHELILEREEPAGVLRDLGEVLRFLNVPVQRGWGLPNDATPWLPGAADNDPSDRPAPSQGSTEIQSRVRPHQGSAALAAGIGATLVGLIITLMLMSRFRRGLDVAPLSLVLPLVSLSFVYLISALVGTARVRVRKNGTLSIEKRALGVTWQKTTLPSRSIRTAYAVDPGTRRPRHVVLQTETGPVGIPSVDDGARALERALCARRSR